MCGDGEYKAPAVTVQAPTPSKAYSGDELDELLNLQHGFHRGVYTRQASLKVPKGAAGVLIIGREWKVPHIFYLAKGNLLLWDKFNGFRHVTGPYSEFAAAGTQRIGWVIDEFEGCNIVKCAATNRAQAEDELIAEFVEPPGLSEQITQLLRL
jgi:hypothetical protein